MNQQADPKTDTPAEAKLAFQILEAAAIAGVGKTTIYEELADGRLVARKARGRTIILREDLIAWLAGLPTWEKSKGPRRAAA